MVQDKPTKRDFCEVCWKPVRVALDFDNRKEKAVCCIDHYVIESLFVRHYSDNEYEMRRYFNED